jgi:aspartate-semialdehyde dehydrogenase
MEKTRVAVLGATGMVGQYFLNLLHDHPFFEVAAICASDARIGQPLGDIRPLHPDGIPAGLAGLCFTALDPEAVASQGAAIAFSALPADVARTIEPGLADRGIHVFSNASAFRMDPHVPILIPEVNFPHLALARQQQRKGMIITNANCTSTGLALSLLPLQPLGIKKLIIASYQAVSGAGYPGVPALDISGNVIPWIDGEEAKVCQEIAKIFGQVAGAGLTPADWEIHAHCVRVPTLVGHLISTHVELAQSVSQAEIEARYLEFKTPPEVAGLPMAPERPILLTREQNRPQPQRDAEAGGPGRQAGMATVVGRLEVQGHIVRQINLSNNLVRGAAGGSVLNAELALRMGILHV